MTLGACALATPKPPTPDAVAAAGHSMHEMPVSAAEFDLAYIDNMITHHEGAVAMATEARGAAQHAEVRAMAESIIASQEGEITQMRAWRAQWYPGAKAAPAMADMGPMAVPAGRDPWDIRFIDAMIPHHTSAVAMATDALAKGQHAEIKTLAGAIIKAQRTEIELMQRWRKEWAPAAAASSLAIADAWARPAEHMDGMADMNSAVYLRITNTGAGADRLVEVASDVAASIELHESQAVDGMVHMNPMPAGLEIPAGGAVELKPAGMHLMLTGVKHTLAVGESFPVTLTFASGAAQVVSVKVREP